MRNLPRIIWFHLGEGGHDWFFCLFSVIFFLPIKFSCNVHWAFDRSELLSWLCSITNRRNEMARNNNKNNNEILTDKYYMRITNWWKQNSNGRKEWLTYVHTHAMDTNMSYNIDIHTHNVHYFYSKYIVHLPLRVWIGTLGLYKVSRGFTTFFYRFFFSFLFFEKNVHEVGRSEN